MQQKTGKAEDGLAQLFQGLSFSALLSPTVWRGKIQELHSSSKRTNAPRKQPIHVRMIHEQTFEIALHPGHKWVSSLL